MSNNKGVGGQANISSSPSEKRIGLTPADITIELEQKATAMFKAKYGSGVK